MGEEFQGGVCGGNWWNSSKNLFSTSPCLSTINDLCSFGGLSSSLSTVTSTDDLVSSMPYTNVVVQDGAKVHDHMGVSNHNWNQDFLNNTGKSDENYSQEAAILNTSMNFCEDFSTNSLNQDFGLEQQSLTNNSNQCAEFSINSAPYDYSSSSLLQTMFDSDSQPHHLLNNHPTNYSQAANCPMINDFSPTLPKSCTSHLKFTNNASFWNSNVSVLNNVRPNFPTPMQSQFTLPQSNDTKANISNFTRKHRNNEEAGKMAMKTTNEPAIKRPRIETPSPLPTFKVRKEKLGDRVTALQQLVSPFGKTDTASVLHEAIDYIKFLHDQVNVLSAPYMKKGSPQLPSQQGTVNTKDELEGLKQDLRSRGLCLVPITSTFPVSTESPTDFWTPTFGGCFR